LKAYLVTYPKKIQYILLTGDAVVVWLSVVFSYAIRISVNQHEISIQLIVDKLSIWLIFIIVSYLLSNYLMDLYNPHKFAFKGRSFNQLVASVFLANIMVSVCFYFAPKFVYGRQVFLINCFISLVLLAIWRWFLGNKLKLYNNTKRLGLVGKFENVVSFAAEITRITNHGVIVTSVSFVPALAEADLPNLRGSTFSWFSKLDDFLSDENYEVLLFDSVSADFSDQDTERIMRMKYFDKAVFDLATYYKDMTGRIPLQYIDGNWLLQKETIQGTINRYYVKLKRLFDIALSGLLLLLFSPLLLILSIFIKIDSKGNIFFIQERLGENKTTFKCYKLRTMVVHADDLSGPRWTEMNDERITRIGKILRKTRLDELPQLFNIFIGDMSFIGPRPIRRFFADKLTNKIPFYDLRFSVKPGLSGWAQVSFGYAASEEEQRLKFEYELFYIQNMSFVLDCVIIVKTLKTLFQIQGK